MAKISYGSLLAWGRVTANRGDLNAWGDFQKRYSSHVFEWAAVRTGSKQVAEEVTVDVFRRLFLRVTNERLPPVSPNVSWSFKPYIRQVVKNLCEDYRRRRGRAGIVGMTDEEVARLEDFESSEDLGERLDERERRDRCIAMFAVVYKAAVETLKADPQYEPRSFAIFLRLVGDGRQPKEVDAEFGLKAGLASKTAGRFRKRLLEAMGRGDPIVVVTDENRSGRQVDPDVILDELVRIYGDPSE